MANTISATYFRSYQSISTISKTTTGNKTVTEKNSFASFTESATVEFSDAGLNALAQTKTDTVDENAGSATGEPKLSAKAQSYLDNLRKKYGDYDFVVSNNLDAAQTVGSSKEYSVIFTPEELEQMAEDDEYAEKVMGKVGDAVDMLKNLSEKDLGEGVQFSQLSVSFDSDGNMKLFAQLEKLSADQKERFDAAREKRAEEQKKAEDTDDEETEPVKILFKSADIEAANEEELLAKILGIDWENIAEEETFI